MDLTWIGLCLINQKRGGMIMDFGNDMPDYESDDFDNYNYD